MSQTIEEMIKNADCLSYLNAIKTSTSELKTEINMLKENLEYAQLCSERIQKIMRRMDNQYRAVVKAVHNTATSQAAEIDPEMEKLMEGIDDE